MFHANLAKKSPFSAFFSPKAVFSLFSFGSQSSIMGHYLSVLPTATQTQHTGTYRFFLSGT
ncbi:hypothetical protein B6S09_01200 [Oceanimonas baumannii]|uniref:Uncharacterized protein n=1 Tax=Oceanimonas baumannii TaxID=129578 RepID=A0A235CQS5_9GAMM|nr:hypothetical protein B6S09_01200 [Oceanimonas baumannii]